MASILTRAKNAVNAFLSREPTPQVSKTSMPYTISSQYSRPHATQRRGMNERTMAVSVLNRIALDCASIPIRHVQLDDNDRYLQDMDSGLNYCFTWKSNIDQAPRAFLQDVYQSMFEEGDIAVIPIVFDTNSDWSVINDVYSMRVGKIVRWMPKHVTIEAYNEETGRHEQRLFPKTAVTLVPNPFSEVMNKPNGTLQRLTRVLNALDVIDKQTTSGKLDLIVQLPYSIRNELKQEQADKRKKSIEEQLTNSKYGIAYIDAAEKITQLNRSLDNNIMNRVEYLTNQFYAELCITKEIMDGTADDKVMQNYMNRVIEPCVTAVVEAMRFKWVSEEHRLKKQSIMYFQNMFKLIPLSEIGDTLDKLSRNEFITGNEGRQMIGMKPSQDPAADELRNKNISQSDKDLENKMATNDETDETEPMVDE